MNLNDNSSVAIIGAGPSGMTAALYLKKAGIQCTIFESSAPGGTLNNINKIENYPGYTDECGSTLAFKMYMQIENMKIDIKTENIINLKEENNAIEVITKDNIYYFDYVIIATGKKPKKLDVKDAYKYEGKGISYCAICDGSLYRNKNVAIVGGGDSSLEAMKYLKNIVKKIYVINRSNNLRTMSIEIKNLSQEENINILYNSKITNIIGDNKGINSIVINNDRKIYVSAIFVFIGQEKNDSFYKNLNIKQDSNGIIVDDNMKTNNDKIYACGDSISKKLYQVVTATSDGAIAASSIIRKIKL